MKLAWLGVAPLALLALGWRWRRRRVWHAGCMMAAFGIDVALLLYVELTRQAVATAAAAAGTRWVLDLHLAFSAPALLLYGALIGSGIWQWRKPAPVALHRWAGPLFAVCRAGGFVTSFFVAAPAH